MFSIDPFGSGAFMKAWERLLIIIPAGLALGAVGGHLASPVPVQRGDDSSWRTLFETRAQRYGTTTPQAPLTDATYYSDSYSYPPYLDDTADDSRSMTGWQGQSFDNWPDYTPAPMPTIAELRAQVAARNAVVASEAASAAGALPNDDPADDLAAQGAGEAISSDDDALPIESDSAEDAPHPKIVVFPRATASPAVASAEPPAADGAPALW
jgi:hypothetical protein